MRKLLIAGLIVLVFSNEIKAQNTFPETGQNVQAKTTYAVYASEIWLNPDEKLSKATLVVKEGKIVKILQGKQHPKGSVFKNYEGKTIYPSFIDLWSSYGVKTEKLAKQKAGPHYESSRKGPYYWNDAIRPETKAVEYFTPDAKAAKEYLAAGFGLVLTQNNDGIARGYGALVSLDNGSANATVVNSQLASLYSFSKGSSAMNYPSSLMGSMALLRQYFEDAKWYSNPINRDHQNLSLEEALKQFSLPTIMDGTDALSVLRAEKVFAKDFKKLAIKATPDLYKVAEQLSATTHYILPLNFPAPLKIDNPYEFDWLNLEEMKHWEWAPKGASMLKENRVDFSFTYNGHKSAAEFLKNVKKAVEYGLSEKEALKALTTNPAKFLEIENAGKLKKGNLANFIVCTGSPFTKEGKIVGNWVQGNEHLLTDLDEENLSGKYTVTGFSDSLLITYKEGKNTASLKHDSVKSKASLTYFEGRITLSGFANTDSSFTATFSNIEGWKGSLFTNGENIEASLLKVSENTVIAEEKKQDSTFVEPANYVFPLKAYGSKELPKAGNYLVKNTTVWTNEESGILKETDVVIANGKIVSIGKNLSVKNATVINGKGIHLTSGIIDEHSHIAISKGVNESGQAVTAEVTIEDVINPWDVNIYRQLAGGVTASQLLHGSANPIGGRSALVKLKYGVTPNEMLIPNADGFIKFALGENVKQANWGEKYTRRFPQSRTGVEQLFVDAFSRALDYEKRQNAYKSLSKGKRKITPKPPRDLEAEYLLEIIQKKRFVTCHSYVQSEINMLMKVAEQFNFNINTFTHILEGYKLADKMKEHGAAGSTFADWWAYKFEVNDAIPYNAAILHNKGVLTGLNSDDAEMGRRLNQEAAKIVKYGGVSEEDAWKMVTLNPAKMLHLDDRMGSIKIGKDADLVLWSTNPLSIEAKALKTFVDGTLYFDRDKLKEQEEFIRSEKWRLLKAMETAIKSGDKPKQAAPKNQRLYHCDSEENEAH